MNSQNIYQLSQAPIWMFLVGLSIEAPISPFEEKEVGAMARVDLWQTQEARTDFRTMDLGWYLTTLKV